MQDYIQSLRRANKTVEDKITEAEGEVDTNPTEAQKQAGNYKKGHVKIDGYDVTIENPKGSVRSGTDASGKEWSITMNNTYGYIRGTEGVDGDHIDVFFSDNPSQGDVFVIDQVNKDGSFDEHKVMYGFSSEEEARQAYLSNYEEGWQGLGAITHVTKEEFKKWVDSSHRKTKPFAEYKNVKVEGAQNGKAGENANEPTVLRLNGEEKSVVDIENTVMEHVQRIIDEGGFDAEIVGVKVIGSYMRGEQTSESDLDVLVEYKGKAKEDVLFNAIAEEGLEINGVNVDINPITKGKSGTIEEFIKRNAGFSKVAKAEGAEVNTEVYSPQTWDESSSLEDVEARLKLLEDVFYHPWEEQSKKAFPDAEQFHAEAKALIDKYGGNDKVPKEEQDALAAKYADYVGLQDAMREEIYALRELRDKLEANMEREKLEETKQQKIAEQLAKYNGYLRGRGSLQASSIERNLSKKMKIDGEVATVAEFIERWLADGSLNVSTRNYKPQINRRRWNQMSGQEQSAWEASHDKLKTEYLVNDYELGKTAYDYAKWLLSERGKGKLDNGDVEQRRTNVNKDGLVVDAEGNPLTLYHGTPNDVELASLEMGHTRDGEEVPARFNGNGISFTPDRTVAVEYSTNKGGEGKVFSVNVTLKKPYFTVGVANFTPEESVAFTEKLIAQGYDGIINYSSQAMRDSGALPNEVIVFDIKSVEQTDDTDGKTDSQGNPLNADGTLKLEKIGSIDELTDEDFSNPTRNVELPALPKNVNEAIGANGKPVIIKKNIFEKNKSSHKDLTSDDSRKILSDVLYNPNLYGQNQKATRPYNWILVHLADKNEAVVVEVNDNKDNIEIINWHYLTDKTLEQKKRQAVKEGSLILTLESAAGNTLNDLSSADKGTNNSANSQKKDVKNDAEEKKEQKSDTATKDETKQETPKEEDIETLIDKLGEESTKAETGKTTPKYNEIVSKIRKIVKTLPIHYIITKKQESANVSSIFNDELRRIDEEFRESGIMSIERFRQLTTGIKEKAKKKAFKLADYIADKKSNYTVLQGIYHDPDGYAVATDAHILVAIKENVDEKTSGKIIKPDGTEIDAEYLHWKSIIRTDGEEQAVDFNKLLDFILGVKEEIKGLSKADRGNFDVVLRFPNGTIIPFDLNLLEKFAILAINIGANSINVKDANSSIIAKSDKGYVLLMPMRLNSVSDYYDFYPERLPYGYAIQEPSAENRDNTKNATSKATDNDPLAEIEDKETYVEKNNKKGGEVKKKGEKAGNDALEDTLNNKKPTEATQQEKIEDVGEKIGGARKDMAGEYKKRAEEDLAKSTSELEEFISKTPISKIFNFDFKKLREQGMSNEVVSFIKICKQAIPAKPRNLYKLKKWVSGTLSIYEMCLKANTNWDRIKELIDNTRVGNIYQAYMAVGGFDSGLELNEAVLHQLGKETYAYRYGEKISLEGKWRVENAGAFDGIYDTKEEAIEALKKFAGKNAIKPDTKQIKFVVYRRREDNICYITPKGKSDVIIQDGFKTATEAFDYIREHQAEMEERYRTLMSDTKVEFAENRERKGRDYRRDKNISAQEFMEAFGFRGVEFGNWTNQEDRQKSINNAYDALMDLAEVLGVSPRALSLNGKLGMAFGARGTGKFNAHYEPDKVVINLTKTKGAGSLAHEWFHALDHYFATLGKAGSMAFATNLFNLLPERVHRRTDKQGNYKYYNYRGTELSEEEVIKAFEANGVRREMVEAWYYLMDKIRKSDYNKRSNAYSGLHKDNYWTEPTELGARAFSKWVENELSKRNAINDYLANNPALFAENVDETERKYAPYPFDTDAEWMEDAFGNLFQTMEQKTDDATGNVILYQKSDGTVEKLSTEEEALRDELVGVLKQAGIEVITDNEQAQKVLDEANTDDMRQQKAPDVRFFRTTDGHAYGFTYKGKVYIDANSATAETPIHEYSHLWASAFRKSNPKEWANIVELMKGTPIWEEVKKKYPELTTDDEVADEVLAHYSGRRGAERLRAEQKKVTDSDKSILDKASAVSAIENVKQALKRFWKGVADWLNIHFTSAEDVADKVLADMLNGVNPTLNAIKEEENAIIAKAKANGTYMKAPNGNPTNLNEKQWVQVRTKAFKNWFGDWEKAARIEKLRKSESASITGKEIEPSEDLKQYKKNALEYGKTLRGEYTNKDTGETISLTGGNKRGGIREILQHDYKDVPHLQSIAAIPQIIENAVFIDELPNDDMVKYAGVKSFRYYVCGLKIGGENYTVKAVVAVQSNGTRYYDHKLSEIEKGELLSIIPTIQKAGIENNLPSFVGKDTRLFSILQTNSSKVVDENGEPLVVYHGSGDTFTIFSPQSEWHGNFFSSERSVAESYSPTADNVIFEERKRPFVDVKFKDGRIERQYYDLGGIYNVYLNINKPLVVDCKGKNWNDIHFKGIKTTTDHISDYALKQGYDGVIFINLIDGAHRGLESSNSFVAFNSNQVKSAIENIGTFDSENPDIRYQFVGESSAYKAKDGSTMTWRSLLSEEGKQGISEKKDGDGSFDPTSVRLRKLDAGETCHVERRYVENGMFDFTGKDKVESVDDVAYIFRQLENAAVENSFMVLVKDGKPTVIHLAMGAYTSTMAPFEHAFVAYSKLNPDEVYFVHNHPSGTLKASQQDQATLDRMKKVFGDDVVNPGIIIDTTSGKYGIFDGMNNIQQKMPVVQEGAVPIKVYNFSKQVFAKDWNPMNAFKIKSDDDVATFVSSHRLGEHKKMSLLVLGNDNSVVANLFLPFTRIGDLDNVREACNLMSDYIHQCGGVCGLLYGNYDYTIDENRLISNISSRMKELGTRLLDVIHVEHSAQNVGLVYEPGASDKELMDAENVSDDTMYRIREDEPPTNTGIGYKVFVLKDGKLYPPMVANPNGEATPVGVWLDADAAPIVGETKTGRSQVKAGGKGTQGGSGTLSYRPGWHLGEIPYALQFNRNDENGERTLFPANFVWAEVEYANDVDYQEEAMSYGYNQNGKFRHSYAGLPRVPVNGAYTYRTNPNPETDPWIITGAMKVNRLLTPTEVDEMVKAAGREPQRRQGGAVTDAEIEALNEEINNANRDANEDINEVNDRFNEELGRLTEENKDKVVLSLGSPSAVLLSAGIEDKPMKLYGNKVIKKMKKHGFTLGELKDLPRAVADPIAVFDNIGREGNRSILTELRTKQGNFLVTVDLGKDADIDFNIISSVFGKGDNNIADWINKGFATYINKEKALAFLSHPSAPIAAAAANAELDSAAKVVQNFENPSIDEEKISPNRITLRKQMTDRVKELAERLII